MRHLFCLLFYISLTAPGNAEPLTDYSYEYTPGCAQAYNAYMALDIPAADALIKREYISNPRNLMATYLSDYGDALILLFNGSRTEYADRKANLDLRLKLLERGSDTDPWKRFTTGGLHLHWALIRVRMGDNVKGAFSLRKSLALLKENMKLFPDFAYSAIYQGLEEAQAGTLPSEYRWAASILGIKGNVRKGIAKIAGFLNANTAATTPFRAEAVIYHSYLSFYLLYRQAEMYRYITSAGFPAHGNLMNLFVRANIAINYRQADVAIATLREAAALPQYASFPSMDYELGSALLTKLDAGCGTYLQRFIARSPGDLYIKDAWYKIATARHLGILSGSETAALSKVKTSGSSGNDADKTAKRFAENPVWPAASLLRARLLNEGGYYTQSLKILTDPAIANSLTTEAEKLEFQYRLAKALESTGQDKAAEAAYQLTMQQGKDREEQFGARAALALGLMYEEQNRKTEARQHFALCLGMKNHDFQSSIDQQAKAGLDRLQ